MIKRLAVIFLAVLLMFNEISFINGSQIQANATVGFTSLKPSANSRVVYVSSSQGNDSNTGLSTSKPVKTLSKARSLVRDGNPDWILLRRGDTWTDERIGTFINGKSPTEPAVISY